MDAWLSSACDYYSDSRANRELCGAIGFGGTTRGGSITVEDPPVFVHFACGIATVNSLYVPNRSWAAADRGWGSRLNCDYAFFRDTYARIGGGGTAFVLHAVECGMGCVSLYAELAWFDYGSRLNCDYASFREVPDAARVGGVFTSGADGGMAGFQLQDWWLFKSVGSRLFVIMCFLSLLLCLSV